MIGERQMTSAALPSARIHLQLPQQPKYIWDVVFLQQPEYICIPIYLYLFNTGNQNRN